MMEFLRLFLQVLVATLRTQAQLEAERPRRSFAASSNEIRSRQSLNALNPTKRCFC